MVQAARNLITEHRSQELQDAARVLPSIKPNFWGSVEGGGEGEGGGERRAEGFEGSTSLCDRVLVILV